LATATHATYLPYLPYLPYLTYLPSKLVLNTGHRADFTLMIEFMPDIGHCHSELCGFIQKNPLKDGYVRSCSQARCPNNYQVTVLVQQGIPRLQRECGGGSNAEETSNAILLISVGCIFITKKARQTAYCMLENLCSVADTDTGSSDFLTIDPGRTKIRTVNNITDHNSENLISG
jgi:hypothetical protein